MKSQNTVDWKKLIQEWKDSGLTKSAFCRNHGLSEGRFYNHFKRLKAANEPTPEQSSKALPIESFVEMLPEQTVKRTISKSIVINMSYGCRIEIPL